MYRSRKHRILAGVCGGIADKTGMPPTLVRAIWLILSLFPGPMWIVYAVMWFMVPEEPQKY